MAFVRGKPQLATWSNADNRLRLFELDASDVFVAQGDWEIIPYTVGTNPPSYNNTLHFLRLGFFKDYLWAHVRTSEVANEGLFNTYKKGSLLSSISALVFGAFSNLSLVDTFVHKLRGLFFPTHTGTSSSNYAARISDSGIASMVPNTQPFDTGLSINSKTTLSPDGKFIGLFIINVGFVRWSEYAGSVDSNGNPVYPTIASPTTLERTPIPFSTTTIVTKIRWTNDSKYMILAQKQNDTENGYLSVLQYDPSQSTPSTKLTVQTINLSGHPVQVAVHPSGRYVAVGIRNNAGTTWRLELYRRMGKYLQLVTTINDAGRGLDFTQDGRFLVDAVSHKAWNFNVGTGALTTNSTILANVNSNATQQTLSDHVDLLGSSSIYDEFLERSAEGSVNSLDLKLIPLTNTATFTSTHTTVDQVTDSGANQPVTVDFPVGGLVVDTADVVISESGVLQITASDISVQVTEDITFTKALLFDDTTDMPIMFIDLGKSINPPLKTTVKFSLSEYPIAAYRVV